MERLILTKIKDKVKKFLKIFEKSTIFIVDFRNSKKFELKSIKEEDNFDRKTGIKTIQLMNNCLFERIKLSEIINYKQAVSYINVFGEPSKSSLPIL